MAIDEKRLELVRDLEETPTALPTGLSSALACFGGSIAGFLFGWAASSTLNLWIVEGIAWLL
jgi:hypothetical protein